ncbi:kinetochore-associated protein 1-like [Biomphalaria glabrata]|uniref:Kinetochore-associated protein 1-like n=1 Tax=Biomphalaria glabrata TaxID=6526 RepID=A0A9W2YX66_BIOGL|nr:kinetochore-associated protein 1-like [Biomphalaria glabrata]
MESKWIIANSEETNTAFENVIAFTNGTYGLKQPPVIRSAAASSNFCVLAIDSMLAVVHEQDVCCTYFKGKIEDVAILEGGYIAVADQTGALALGVFNEKFKVKHSCNFITEKSACQENVYTKIEFQRTVDDSGRTLARLACLCTSGRLLVFKNILLLNGDLDLSLVTMDRLESAHIQAFDFISTEMSIVTVGSGADCLAVYTFENSTFCLSQTASLENDRELVKIQVLSSANIYLTLDSQGTVHIWDAFTLCIVYTWSMQGVDDFRIMEHKTEQNLRLENITLLTKGEDKLCSYEMLTKSVKEFMPRADLTRFSKWPQTDDDIFVATCAVDNEDGQMTVSLQNFAETSPHKRLQYLLSRRRFDEAEMLAKLHGLHFVLEPVFVQQRLRESKETFEETRRHIAKCKVQLLENKSRDEKVAQILSEISDMERRLEAYARVFGENHFSTKVWAIFQVEEPAVLFEELLLREAERAFIFWECYKDDLVLLLKPLKIRMILNSIPSQVPCVNTRDWLINWVIPFMIPRDPDAVTAVIEWTEQQVSVMEATNKKSWSTDAINFCQIVLENLELAANCDIHSFDPAMLMTVKSKFSCASLLTPLRDLIKCLHWLDDLCTKYNYNIGLEALKKETQESVVFRMLDRVMMVDLLPQTLQDQVLPYIQHNDLQADQLFAGYVQDLLDRSAGGTMHYLVIEKMKAFIRLIGSLKEKTNAVLNLLNSVTFPLPEFVKEITEEILSKHPELPELKLKWRMTDANNTIFTYGIQPSSVKTVSHVKLVAQYIIAQGGQFSDVEKLLSANNVSDGGRVDLHYFQCQLFVDRDQLDSLRSYLRTLTHDTAKQCCLRLIAVGKSLVSDHDLEKAFRMLYFEAIDIASAMLLSLTDNLIEKGDIEQQLQAVRNQKKLEVHYSVLVNYTILEDKGKCLKILKEQTDKLKFNEIFYFSSLLSIEDFETLKVVMQRASALCPFNSLGQFMLKLSELIPPTSLSAEFLQSVVELLSAQDICWPYLCHRLSQLFWAHLAPENFNELKEMCCLSTIMVHMFEQSQAVCSRAGNELWPDDYFTDLVSDISPDFLFTDLLETLQFISEDDHENALVKMTVLLEDLVKSGQNQIVMKILIMVFYSSNSTAFLSYNKLADHNVCSLVSEEIRNAATSLVSQMVERPRLDPLLALATVVVLPKDQAGSLLKSAVESCGSNFSKMKRISLLATAAAEIYKDSKLIEECRTLNLAAKWGVRLSKIGIQFKYGQASLLTAACDALQKLIQSPHCQADILLEYFRDMQLESFLLNESLMKLFESCLIKQSHGKSSEKVLARAKSFLSLIKNNKLKLLKNIVPKISSYNYEALEFVLTEILALEANEEASQGIDLIRYLKYYTRCTVPSETEIRICRKELESEELAGVLPEISSARLPYHLLKGINCGKIITPEMKPQTLTYWLNLASVLNLKRDIVIGNTVSNVMESYLQSAAVNTSSATVSSEFLSVANQVEAILSRVEDKRYQAELCCNSLLDRFRHAGELTLVLQIALRYAEQWLASARESGQAQEEKTAKQYVDLFTKKLRASSTQWALHKIGLHKDAELVSLVKQPKELIFKLYHHSAVVDNTRGRRDVNLASDEIAAVHGLNITEIRQSLLDKWLLGAPASSGDLDQTMTFGNVCENVNEEEDIERSVYVLSSSDRQRCLSYLADYLRQVWIQSQAKKKILFVILKSGGDVEMSNLEKVIS